MLTPLRRLAAAARRWLQRQHLADLLRASEELELALKVIYLDAKQLDAEIVAELKKMNLLNTPIELPLERGINRCLGVGYNLGETCHLHETCAAWLTIKEDPAPVPAAYRKCTNQAMASYIPIHGFHDLEADPQQHLVSVTQAGSGEITPAVKHGAPIVDGGEQTTPNLPAGA